MANEDDEILWPHGENKPDEEKLFDLVKEIADEKTKEKLVEIESEYEAAKKVVEGNGNLSVSAGRLLDMPETVLDGRLGELCSQCMLAGNRFPVAYA